MTAPLSTILKSCEPVAPIPHTVFPLHCPEQATAVVALFAQQQGFQTVETIRINEYAVFRLSSNSDTAIVRVAHPSWRYQQSRQLSLVGEILDRDQTLAGEPIDTVIHPIEYAGEEWNATVWVEHIPLAESANNNEAIWHVVGQRLANLHSVTNVSKYGWQEIPRLARRLIDIDSNGTTEFPIRLLASALLDLHQQTLGEPDPLGIGLLHGDLKAPNIVLDRDTFQPRLIDFSFAGWGPLSWDLAVLDEKLEEQAFASVARGYGISADDAQAIARTSRWLRLRALHRVSSRLLYSPGVEADDLAKEFLAKE